MDLFVGMDVGGTRSRAAVIDAAGRVLGTAAGPGGNPISHPPEQAFRAMAAALGEALRGLPAAHVRAAVIGMAGNGSLAMPRLHEALTGLATAVGIGCRPVVSGDVVCAFASGTAAPDGTVLVAGTGAISARIIGWVHAGGVDGHGWLLGDRGSAFWLGRNAVRAALAALDGRQETTVLLPAVTEALLGAPEAGPRTAERIIEVAHAAQAISLAALAPIVSTAARAGDAVAQRIVEAAATALVADVAAIRDPGEATPIVLAGSVAAGDTPVAELVRERLEALRPSQIVTAGDAARAAAWLAATGDGPPDPQLHAAVMASDGPVTAQ